MIKIIIDKLKIKCPNEILDLKETDNSESFSLEDNAFIEDLLTIFHEEFGNCGIHKTYYTIKKF
jgi:hypothetical protein